MKERNENNDSIMLELHFRAREFCEQEGSILDPFLLAQKQQS